MARKAAVVTRTREELLAEIEELNAKIMATCTCPGCELVRDWEIPTELELKIGYGKDATRTVAVALDVHGRAKTVEQVGLAKFRTGSKTWPTTVTFFADARTKTWKPNLEVNRLNSHAYVSFWNDEAFDKTNSQHNGRYN